MSLQIRLEDNFEDVLGKAAKGAGLSKDELSGLSGVPAGRISELLSGKFNEPDLLKVATALKLHGPSLTVLAQGQWKPDPVELEGLLCYNTPFPVPGYQEMTVNSYLVFDPASKAAVAFDTGASVKGMLEDIRRLGLKLELVLLTHSHEDHIRALNDLIEAAGNPPVWLNEREGVPRAKSFAAGKSFSAGGLAVESRLTHGHSPGGTTFVIRGLERPVAIVGDSLFAGSMGGAGDAYATALENNRKQILSLPDETVLCPGHGPLTTVGWEKARNPFFPEFK